MNLSDDNVVSLQEHQCNISARFTVLSLVTMTMEILSADSDIYKHSTGIALLILMENCD